MSKGFLKVSSKVPKRVLKGFLKGRQIDRFDRYRDAAVKRPILQTYLDCLEVDGMAALRV